MQDPNNPILPCSKLTRQSPVILDTSILPCPKLTRHTPVILDTPFLLINDNKTLLSLLDNTDIKNTIVFEKKQPVSLLDIDQRQFMNSSNSADNPSNILYGLDNPSNGVNNSENDANLRIMCKIPNNNGIDKYAKKLKKN